MRIAQIAPLIESVPPRLNGGTERIARYLCEELVAQGHDVTLFASGNYKPRQNWCHAVHRHCGSIHRSGSYSLLHADARQSTPNGVDFDMLHFHIDQFHFPIFHDFAHRTVTTLHGRQDLRTSSSFTPASRTCRWSPSRTPSAGRSQTRISPVTSPRPAKRSAHPDTASPRGLPRFFGRISPEKRVDRAIEIHTPSASAQDRRQGRPRRRRVLQTEIEPLLTLPRIEYIGEIDSAAKTPSWASARTAVPDRLAGAVRAGADRGDGLRHAGSRLSQGRRRRSG